MLKDSIGKEKTKYEKKDFSHLLGLREISNKLMETHFALYEGYVNNTNKILDDLEEMRDQEKTDTPEYAELKRRFGWEFNGMRLHELYFGGMSMDHNKINKDGKLAGAMKESFGSFDEWKEDFTATGKMRGIGWAILYQDTVTGKLINFWINEHDSGHGAGLNPILVMDVFEHAYMLDWGKDKGAYINTYLEVIDWEEIEKRVR